ncbi:glycosyltransferase [Cellulomonas taurus]|uniref:glycosyltransferase n=1 Tax=Cellulomonas taurus TaxID=2729175 RepID=UPI0031B5FDB8
MTAPHVRWIRRPADGAGARVIHVNTSARGGGVAEIVENVTRHDIARGRRSGWAVIDAPDEFFAFTKGLHHLFHGRGDPHLLAAGGATYRQVLDRVPALLEADIRADDIVVLHDPQTLGLARWAAGRARRVYWHCHIGSLQDPDGVKGALWDFFADDLSAVDAVLVTEPGYLVGATVARVRIVRPAIDPEAPKNATMSDDEVARCLRPFGAVAADGAVVPGGRVWQDVPLPEHAPMVLQVSRWDPLKGMADVLRSTAELEPRTHVVLAGPDPAEVLDDPEGIAQLRATLQQVRALPAPVRRRVHVIALSSHDRELNALCVNALQRRADVVVQRSLEEGFGLTVTEAMFKGRPVVASHTGGIPRQIDHGVSGLLVHPGDDRAFVTAVNELLADEQMRMDIGAAAESSVRGHYLIDRLATDYDLLRH